MLFKINLEVVLDTRYDSDTTHFDEMNDLFAKIAKDRTPMNYQVKVIESDD